MPAYSNSKQAGFQFVMYPTLPRSMDVGDSSPCDRQYLMFISNIFAIRSENPPAFHTRSCAVVEAVDVDPGVVGPDAPGSAQQVYSHESNAKQETLLLVKKWTQTPTSTTVIVSTPGVDAVADCCCERGGREGRKVGMAVCADENSSSTRWNCSIA